MSLKSRAARLAKASEPYVPHATVPAHITVRGISARQWRAKKRQEIVAALKALHAVRIGCAFIPMGSACVDRAQQSLEDLRAACSVKAWKQ